MLNCAHFSVNSDGHVVWYCAIVFYMSYLILDWLYRMPGPEPTAELQLQLKHPSLNWEGNLHENLRSFEYRARVLLEGPYKKYNEEIKVAALLSWTGDKGFKLYHTVDWGDKDKNKCFWQAVTCLWSLHVAKISVTQISTTGLMSTWPAGLFCLCCFWQAVSCLWSLHVAEIPCHTDIHPRIDVFLTSCFILSVWYLTGGDTSVVPTCLGALITGTSTLVGTSTWPPGSFYLCCFWQAVRCVWSLHMSGICCYMDLHPGRNVYQTSCFILSVLFLTGGKTSLVPTCVLDPPSHRSPPW